MRLVSEGRRDTRAGAQPHDAATLQLYVGTTSGHAYSWWQGRMYPSGLPSRDMQEYGAREFGAVEIGSSLYRVPAADLLRAWAAETPSEFRFALVASSRITHLNRLVGVDAAVRYFVAAAKALGRRAGPVLFQFPLSFPKDEARLAQFLELLPADFAAAFEFRHPSWHAAGVYRQLEGRNYALSVTDTEGAAPRSIVATADWGYVRLRRAVYDDIELATWLEGIRGPGWREAYVFFRHDDDAGGARCAQHLCALAAQR